MQTNAPTLDVTGTAPDTLAVYVHWPFCLAKCPYCDFNSHVRDGVDAARWRDALLAELAHDAALTPGRVVTSVFFGGGTPSLMPGETAAAILDRIAALWALAPDAEITLEANPTSVEAGRFADFAAAGVNRVSLGVQALDDTALKFLGRGHDAAEAREAVALAARHFPRFSFDLIYARPGQGVGQWRAELDDALAMAGEHLSVYQLTIEPGTHFHTLHRQGAFALPDEATGAALFDVTQDRLAAAGLPAYEISNHARPGAECRHNLAYWRYDDYAGVGPGAHGRLTDAAGGKFALTRTRLPEAWLRRVEADGHATAERTLLSVEDRLHEMLLMGLRLGAGVARDRFRRETGQDFEAALDRERLDGLCEAGLLALDDAGLRATPAGLRRLDAVLTRLLS
jgi:oxygen-independent coproporphyrinogen-3 oxidase